jgi:hypothetical protein
MRVVGTWKHARTQAFKTNWKLELVSIENAFGD